MVLPNVSVVIPVYNHARYVAQAVESVLNQGYPNLQVIVVDDGSTDSTPAVLKPYQPRIQYIRKDNGGTASALNLGLALSTGKYICWLSADDVFLPGKISRQVDLMEREPQNGFSYTSFTAIDANGQRQYDVHSSFYPDKREMVTRLVEGCFINGSSVMMRSTALIQAGKFDEGLAQAHDYDLWLRFLRYHSCGFLDEILLAYRWHGENMSRFPDREAEQIVRERARNLFPEWLK